MSARPDRAIWSRLFDLSASRRGSLQACIRETLVAAVLDGHLPPGAAVPSSRQLADQLGIARNTVVAAYQHLVDAGFLVARERSGYFVASDVARCWARKPRPAAPQDGGPRWRPRFAVRPSAQRSIVKAPDWQRFPYPFVYGQIDPDLFPAADWRECSRRSLGAAEVKGWTRDLVDGDDPMLVEQLRTRVLPRRGVFVAADEVMVTVGAQQALYLLAQLLVRPATTVGIEDPGYPDARNIFALRTSRIRPAPVDRHGALPCPSALAGCNYLFVTPSYQCPTTATMPLERREALLRLAAAHDFVVIEDDYEPHGGFPQEPAPALKSLDRAGRVIYVGSLSKSLAPGLRFGFVVGPPELIREARALRRLMLRHPPANNQRTLALFLALGHHEALARRLAHVHRDRAACLGRALAGHLPEFRAACGEGGSSYWLEGPAWLDGPALARRALDRGVLVEPGDVFFASHEPPRNVLRLGFSAIPTDRIAAGVAELAALVAEMAPFPASGRRPALAVAPG